MSRLISEAQLQKAVLQQIQAGMFLDQVDGLETIESNARMYRSRSFIPHFDSDFLLGSIYCERAEKILRDLKESGPILPALNPKSISREIGSRLHPDFVLYNPLSGSFSVFELKVTKPASREAATELLAYAHEIRNHFPFLADSEINLVLIFNQRSTLLERAVGCLLLNTGFPILMLKIETGSDDIRYRVHHPDSWTD